MKTIKSILTLAVCAGVALTSCSEDQKLDTNQEQTVYNKKDLKFSYGNAFESFAKNTKKKHRLQVFQDINETLDGYRIAQVEIYDVAKTPDAIDNVTVIPIPDASSNEYRTGFRFFPNDPRRNGRDNLTYITVSEFATSTNGVASEQIFDDMYAVWENETNCNNVSIDKQDFSLDINGLPSSILSFGDEPLGPFADNNIIGYIPSFLFDAIGASASTLAVTFTFAFTDENGVSTDINGDGKIDTSHTEIWFNDSVNWSNDGLEPGSVDVASVALHEFGHSVGLDHSGTLLATFDNNGQFTGELNYVPTNVMNPAYIEKPKRDLAGDDNAIYCENFSAWPYY